MKENINKENLVVFEDKEKMVEFNRKLDIIKEKVTKLRELEKETKNLELEAKDLCNNFVKEFSNF